MKVSIISVNWNAYDFAELLIESIECYTDCVYETIIVDNSVHQQPLNYDSVKIIPQTTNVGHGQGLNIGIKEAQYDYVFLLDIDCHFLTKGWNHEFAKVLEEYQVIAGKGVPVKPVRPACMMLETNIAKNYDFRPTPGYKGHRVTPNGFDVAIQAYYRMVDDGIKIKIIDSQKSRYNTLNGEEFIINNTPVVYHHWHGSHLKERQIDFQEDLLPDKDMLFTQIPWRKIF